MDLNPATVSKIQHSIGKLFPLSKPVFFRNGVYIVEDQFQILVQPVLSYLGFQVIIGIDKERLRSPSNAELRETLKKLGQYFDKIFTETICGEMEEANPSLTLTRMALSLETLKKNGDSNELVYYDLEIVQERFRCGHKFIDSEELHKGDALVLLLTDSEIKESRRETKVCLKLFVFNRYDFDVMFLQIAP